MNQPAVISNEVATVEQQIELHAQNIERIQRDAVFEIGRELSAIQELHRYRRDDDGFTKWIARRLPHIPQMSAYQAIKIFRGIDGELFTKFVNMSAGALHEVAKAEPDVQALIAARVDAGEIFTAAQVKDLKQKAASEAVERIRSDADRAREELDKLRSELAAKDRKADADTKSLQASIADLTGKLKGYEVEVERFKKSLPKPEKAKEKAAEAGGVVLASDGKFHSGSSIEQKRMHDAFMFAFDKTLDLTENPPSPARVAAGCPAPERERLASLCDRAIAYLASVKEAVSGK